MAVIDDDYGPIVMEHFTNPRNVGDLKDANAVGMVRNGVCGDVAKLFLRIEAGRILEAKFRTFGCGASIAASSVLTELVRGRSLEEAGALTQEDVARALGGLAEPKIHCAVLAEDALRAALEAYRVRTGAAVAP
ncbi:MAG: iron-sulfur cluster assembly scaffold protein [Planctomycetes bacterium]|nr:iron-sulfur cluster assembly scaffold protein [Planctomycetota bacterium]